MRVAVLSDTHAPRFWKQCPAAVARQLATAQLILHAGDLCTDLVLDQLAEFAPVRAVLGNNDGPELAARGLAETSQFEIDGVNVAMIHDSGARQGRLARLRTRFPGANLVIFGHSHIPLTERSADSAGIRILNPGSPTDRRRQPQGTMAMLTISAGRVDQLEIIQL